MSTLTVNNVGGLGGNRNNADNGALYGFAGMLYPGHAGHAAGGRMGVGHLLCNVAGLVVREMEGRAGKANDEVRRRIFFAPSDEPVAAADGALRVSTNGYANYSCQDGWVASGCGGLLRQ